jgi:hypothetical protein
VPPHWLPSLRALTRHPFVLPVAPEGNGVSTLRVWETMYAGSIPVMLELDNEIDDLYATLPAFVVRGRSWAAASPQRLVCHLLLLAAEAYLLPLALPAGGHGGDVADTEDATDATDGGTEAGIADVAAGAMLRRHLRACADKLAMARANATAAGHFDFRPLTLQHWWGVLADAVGVQLRYNEGLSARFRYDADKFE